MLKLWRFLLAFLALGSITESPIGGACTRAAELTALKIGLLLPPEEPFARSIREGALLAQEDANKLGRRKVEVVIRGRAGQWGADGVEAARMVIDDGVEGLIAPSDGAANHLALQVSGRTAVPVISLCADSSISKTGVPWMLRVVPRTADEATALFKGLTDSKHKHWAAIVPDGHAGREISKDLTVAAEACGAQFETMLSVSKDLTNTLFAQKAVLRSRPDVVLLWLAPEPAAAMARELRKSGYSGILAGPGPLLSEDFAVGAGNALENFTLPAILLDEKRIARWHSFQSSYRERWHRESDITAAMSYDAATLMAALLQQPAFRAPPHRLAAGFSWPGLTGALSFDAEGNRIAALVLLRGDARHVDGWWRRDSSPSSGKVETQRQN